MWIRDVAPHFSLGTRLSVFSFTPRPLYTLRPPPSTLDTTWRGWDAVEKRKIRVSETFEDMVEIPGNFQLLLDCYVPSLKKCTCFADVVGD